MNENVAARVRTWAVMVLASVATTYANAVIGEFHSPADFASAVLVRSTDTFSDLASQFMLGPIARTTEPFTYSIDADAFGSADYLYGLPSASTAAPATWLTTNSISSVVTFSGFSANVNGIGGSFFATTFSGDISAAASLQVTATYASGSVSETFSGTTDNSFLGFLDYQQLLSLTISINQPPSGGPYWLTVAGLTLGSLSPVSEVPSAALILLGLPSLLLRRRRARAGCRQDMSAKAANGFRA